jgi:hypothetical protein
LLVDQPLIGAARLQVAVPDQFHVGGFGRSPDHLLLRIRAAAAREKTNAKIACQLDDTGHVFHPGY